MIDESEERSFTAMIVLHFHLLPQFKYQLFHINFTSDFIIAAERAYM